MDLFGKELRSGGLGEEGTEEGGAMDEREVTPIFLRVLYFFHLSFYPLIRSML